MKIKTIYDRLKPGFKSSLQKNARKYNKYRKKSDPRWFWRWSA